MDTKKRVFVIGGITGGIGQALAARLLKSGHVVAGFARDVDRLNALKHSYDCDLLPCDASQPAALKAVLSQWYEHYGRIDGYVHAIGSILLKPAHLTSPEAWIQTIDTNLNTAFYALSHCTKFMSRQGEGSCLFFSTAAAQVGLANHEAIAAAKGGIEAMVRSAAATYSNRGVRINAIAPSLTDTPLAQAIVGNAQSLKISQQMHPLGRIGHPVEVASLAEWLLSDHGSFVTGQTYVVDGGLSTIVPKPRA